MKFPLEIVLVIARACDLSTLAVLTRCCKQYQDLLEPMLYQLDLQRSKPQAVAWAITVCKQDDFSLPALERSHKAGAEFRSQQRWSICSKGFTLSYCPAVIYPDEPDSVPFDIDNIDPIDDPLYTPFEMAFIMLRDAIVLFFLEIGVPENSLVHWRVFYGISELYDRSGVPKLPTRHFTPLHMACAFGFRRVVSHLVASNPSTSYMNYEDEHGNSPLDVAFRQPKFMNYLVGMGFDTGCSWNRASGRKRHRCFKRRKERPQRHWQKMAPRKKGEIKLRSRSIGDFGAWHGMR